MQSCAHLHLRQIFRDDEQLRRRHARRYGLTDVHAALRDDAVDWRRDDRMLEVRLRRVQLRGGLFDVGFWQRNGNT